MRTIMWKCAWMVALLGGFSLLGGCAAGGGINPKAAGSVPKAAVLVAHASRTETALFVASGPGEVIFAGDTHSLARFPVQANDKVEVIPWLAPSHMRTQVMLNGKEAFSTDTPYGENFLYFVPVAKPGGGGMFG